MMTDPRTARATGGPVAASQILRTLERGPVRPRTSKDVMLVTIHGITAFGDRVLSVDCVLAAVQFFEVRRDTIPQRVIPGALSEPVTRVDRWFGPRRGCAEVGVPGVVARPFGFGKRLTLGVGA